FVLFLQRRQQATKLGYRCLQQRYQRGQSLFAARQLGQYINVFASEQFAVERAGSNFQLGVVLGEFREQTGSCTHIVLGHRQTNQCGANQRLVQQRKVRSFQRTTRQSVTNNAYINVVLTSLVAQGGNL